MILPIPRPIRGSSGINQNGDILEASFFVASIDESTGVKTLHFTYRESTRIESPNFRTFFGPLREKKEKKTRKQKTKTNSRPFGTGRHPDVRNLVNEKSIFKRSSRYDLLEVLATG